ncbi:hypothetical protein GO730_16525 [Spirosoma sp. HMF3257]|uniref:DUF4136 domain-containing protein n=1 Tax=Spirosoma telluris TaxID=2183553 RepID=A0A327NT29_9BACT|nr:hypothetical protein [Spirosoma telluris]RAI78477.1 hypothetical protein HMF3257_16465 [Spirosoma telluris]
MKTLFTLFLLSIGFGAVAQRSSSKNVTTDGRELRIRVDIEQQGRSVHYSRSFDIEDMDKSEVKALETHIIDSLDRFVDNQSNELIIDRKHEARARKRQAEMQVTSYSRSDESARERMEANSNSSLSPSDVAPTSVLVKEDKENGRLWMQYTFEKDGEELIIERTANVMGKSEREKQAIIKETERSFGIKTGNQ